MLLAIIHITVKDYYHYSTNDFVMDPYFQAWVWNPTEVTNEFWRTWLDRHPDKNAEVEEARSLLGKLQFSAHKLSEDELSDLWVSIRTSKVQYEGSFRKGQTFKRGWYAAAVAAVALVMVLAFLRYEPKIVYETTYAQTKTVQLPDGSTVMLNANSRISFQEGWNSREPREVKLEGEAYFEVVHTQSNQPFRVQVEDGVAIEVLGTSFNVYHRIADTKVVLNSGKISLSVPNAGSEGKILMNPGELVEFKSNKLSRREVDASLYVAWTKSKLILDHTSLREIIQLLNDNYGMDVRVDNNALLNQTISGSMPMPSAENSVEQLAKAFRLKVTKVDNVFWLKE